MSVVQRPRKSPWPAIPVDEALAAVFETVIVNPACEVAASAVWPGDVLAEDVIARYAIPPYRASIKDGYALLASDGAGDRRVIGNVNAGRVITNPIVVVPKSCVRISTGAALPPGATAVTQVEDTVLVEHDGVEEHTIRVLKAPTVNQDIREAGCDVSIGQVLCHAQSVIGPVESGLLASSGQKTVSIYRKPTVCVISTGNELVDASDDDPSRIRDSNRPQLVALFRSHGFEVIDAGIVPDSQEELAAAFQQAFAQAEVVVASGGVSMGEKDLVKTVITAQLGFTIHFGRVFMKPGLPTTFASGQTHGDSRQYFFGVPGNPVSAWVASLLFVVPALRKMAGCPVPQHTQLPVRLSSELRLDPRPEFVRAWLTPSDNDEDGSLPSATVTSGNQMSSFLISARGANLLLQLPPRSESTNSLPAGTVVKALVIGPI